jgi:hypothetical protein
MCAAGKQNFCSEKDVVVYQAYHNLYDLRILFACILIKGFGPGSAVGIATGYKLDGPGIKFRWQRDFPHLSVPALGPTQRPVQWVPGLSRVKRAAGA